MRNRATTKLTRPKIRQSWSKWNLYNLANLREPVIRNRTFFQQKWSAKSLARGYHGEQVRETQWERMFNRRVRSVIPMSARQLASDDGSAAAAGRGSGLESRPGVSVQAQKEVPYTAMTFAPLERRLDVAIFRALFASSARQARQFVVHGAVTVNGKKMRYPGYLLNPGDMFQVDPERVLYATGAPKNKFDRREARVEKKRAEEEAAKQAESEAEGAEESKESQPEAETKEAEPLDTRKTLQQMISQAKNIMANNKEVLAGKRKQELRGFQKAVRRVLSRSNTSQLLADNLETQFSEILSLLGAKEASKGANKNSKKTKKKSDAEAESKSKDTTEATEAAAVEATKGAEATEPAKAKDAAAATDEDKPTDALAEAFRKAAQNPEEKVDTSELTEEEVQVLKRALVQMRDNPVDTSKPYATPWSPRDYMNAFAFIPRYLEVNQNICAAVYVRHPVARPGYSEVPTPFSEEVSTGAYHWYLRRR
ncbi:hypothetical protein BJY01DRAFT_210017 [Aspergillus pseudoustus]|uniref:RNA-binding S4 domain-containing protein n=1 Tax=Aspergillus pseudoustus TaxID=1810923 RepID=A0ABR4KDQ1_9EURO